MLPVLRASRHDTEAEREREDIGQWDMDGGERRMRWRVAPSEARSRYPSTPRFRSMHRLSPHSPDRIANPFTNRNATAHPRPRTCSLNELAADVLPQASCSAPFSTFRAAFMPQTYGRASVAQSIPCRDITTQPHNVRETKKLLSLIIYMDILH